MGPARARDKVRCSADVAKKQTSQVTGADREAIGKVGLCCLVESAFVDEAQGAIKNRRSSIESRRRRHSVGPATIARTKSSGFRRGSDILKALALGATAVTVGRVSRWGLAAYGAPGAQRVLEILQTELTMAMAATGRPTLASIDKTLVRTDF